MLPWQRLATTSSISTNRRRFRWALFDEKIEGSRGARRMTEANGG